jgi:hypothetical protein
VSTLYTTVLWRIDKPRFFCETRRTYGGVDDSGNIPYKFSQCSNFTGQAPAPTLFICDRAGGYGVVVTQRPVEPLSWVRIPVATPDELVSSGVVTTRADIVQRSQHYTFILGSSLAVRRGRDGPPKATQAPDPPDQSPGPGESR